MRDTMPYAVELWAGSSGEAGWSCTCPVAEDARFCKHAVAVALTWSLEPPLRVPPATMATSKPKGPLTESRMSCAPTSPAWTRNGSST